MAQSEAQAISSAFAEDEQLQFACGLSAAVLSNYWRARMARAGISLPLREGPVTPLKGFPSLLSRIGEALDPLSEERAEFLVGQLYTGLLPEPVRKLRGAFYTPIPLVNRLFQLCELSGLDWNRARIIDPACGGAAFLASVARRMLAGLDRRNAKAALESIEERLLGVEIDPFAAWMTMVFLDLTLAEVCVTAGRRVRPLVLIQDALGLIDSDKLGKFDLVIGNPPYGKVSLSPAVRQRYQSSVFGHANLYGLFTELAVRMARQTGLIAYVTPTSFLGGEYFKKLRALLSREATLVRADIVRQREGVFNGVLQETMLAVFKVANALRTHSVEVSVIESAGLADPLDVETLGSVALKGENGAPWMLPRSHADHFLIERLSRMSARLRDYGFEISTGQLVWNRHKPQLRAREERGCYPIIWAEAVNTDRTFRFQAARRSHLPFLKLERGQDFLVNKEPCILVQRTTAKEQKRRLVAAVVPNSFIAAYPGYIVENHLNMVYPLKARSPFALTTIAALLNSAAVDRVFRCISGSVAVSAYELHALPFPSAEQLHELQEAITGGASLAEIELLIAQFYSLVDSNQYDASGHSRPENRRVAA